MQVEMSCWWQRSEVNGQTGSTWQLLRMSWKISEHTTCRNPKTVIYNGRKQRQVPLDSPEQEPRAIGDTKQDRWKIGKICPCLLKVSTPRYWMFNDIEMFAYCSMQNSLNCEMFEEFLTHFKSLHSITAGFSSRVLTRHFFFFRRFPGECIYAVERSTSLAATFWHNGPTFSVSTFLVWKTIPSRSCDLQLERFWGSKAASNRNVSNTALCRSSDQMSSVAFRQHASWCFDQTSLYLTHLR